MARDDKTSIYDYEIGDIVCDLHDGLRVPEGIRAEACWIENENSLEAVKALLGRDTNAARHYVNKHLIIVGFNPMGTIAAAVASYDGRQFVSVRLMNKSE